MTTKSHRACYGKMMPDFGRLRYNKPTEGKAFRVFIEKIGIDTQRREVELKADAWDDCLECPEYRSCYDLGMAQVALRGLLGVC